MASAMAWNSTSRSAIPLLNTTLLPLTAMRTRGLAPPLLKNLISAPKTSSSHTWTAAECVRGEQEHQYHCTASRAHFAKL